MSVPASLSASTRETSRPEPVHPPQVAFERLEVRRDRNARELDVEGEAFVPFSLPDICVEGDQFVREVRPRSGDSVSRRREGLRTHAAAVHGPPDLVRRKGRDRREEAYQITEAAMESPSRAGVALVRPGC